jgi:hypothetical protein
VGGLLNIASSLVGAPALPKETIMEPASPIKDCQVRTAQVSPQAEKLKIEGVITHEKLMSWIQERNHIIARARKDVQRR